MKNLLFILLLMLSSCSRTDNEAKDDKLLLSKTSYTGIELRTVGYYYTQYDYDMPFIRNATFFYGNGTFLYIGGRNESLPTFEQYVNEVSNNNSSPNNKSGWGLFKIEGNKLYYERWYPKAFGSVFKVFSHECEIINDSTYIVKKQYRLVNGEQTEVTFPNQTYKFVEFANKPSSVNNFIP